MIRPTRIGVLRETKNPPDRRVAITPQQGLNILKSHPNVSIFIQPSDIRCYTNAEYRKAGFFLTEDLRECDILIGVKEVTIPTLIPNKRYLFFSHTAKKQIYNRKLLQEILKRNITLIDYEYLCDDNGKRIVAFGYWAGVVGAYKALRARGMRTDSFDLPPARSCLNMEEMYSHLKTISLKPIKILITGGGRVAKGAMQTIRELKLKEISPEDFLHKTYNEPVVCRIDPENYVERIDGSKFNLQHFYDYPEMYRSSFKPFTKVTDLFIACHYWDPKSPKFIEPEDYKEDDFNISIIADVSCDVNGPIPSTLRPSTIASSFYGYDRFTGEETIPFVDKKNVTVMAVDNLPGELPRESSEDFGKALTEHIFPALLGDVDDQIIERACIAKDGRLTPAFSYLQDYVYKSE
ncbi:alanine dehydrogenase [Ancylomarina euxinus]|uniref:Saccharopine dehydrogenase [NAD(+), L-lysine-forming] n=1 Tax=Ancylomarina euxinus TaxID=2283627 RepID=A0A425Y692_9BACT|nr:NAD(P)-dependent oxidoreductase [Ancylomarina euxinus]MCZ4694112.1 NAD(P)-dependent oxidoreductase [Ancylomarina euxinus]MUP15777.1 alanine dehydrogenase [Ancylomarina euxinus]RRG24019.1 alanine dehydrogenase [Ancylomarina euxinus]